MKDNDSAFVFPRNPVGKTLNVAWVKAGLPNHKLIRKGINNLRYTYGNRLRLAGATDQEREALLGLKYADREIQYAVLNLEHLSALAEATITVEEPDLPIYFQS